MVKKVVILLALIEFFFLPGTVQAQDPQPQTAPCVTATMKALEKKGYPYVWGDEGPNSFDCSGLVQWAYGQAGVSLGRTTYQQAYEGVAVNCDISDLHGESTTCWAVGDLIFLQYPEGQHVAIYAGRGLFIDCYSPAVGCVLHAVQFDSFYVSNFWQARRIVSGCEGTAIDPGTPIATPPSSIESPGIESIPDLVHYVSFALPDLATWWPSESPPDLPDSFNFIGSALYGFLWLAWAIRAVVRELLLTLFWVGQYGVNFLALAINAVLGGVNGLWRLGVVSWLGFKSMFLGLWMLFEDMRSWLAALAAYPKAWILAIFDIFTMVLGIIGQILEMLLAMIMGILGLLGWILGLIISLIVLIVTQFTSTAAPPALTAESDYYFMVHGILRGVVDSRIGWLVVLVWAMCYLGTVFYIASYFSRSESASE